MNSGLLRIVASRGLLRAQARPCTGPMLRPSVSFSCLALRYSFGCVAIASFVRTKSAAQQTKLVVSVYEQGRRSIVVRVFGALRGRMRAFVLWSSLLPLAL